MKIVFRNVVAESQQPNVEAEYSNTSELAALLVEYIDFHTADVYDNNSKFIVSISKGGNGIWDIDHKRLKYYKIVD